MTEAGGDTATEMESDIEDHARLQRGSRKEGDMLGEYKQRRDRIFKYLKIIDKNVVIPNLAPGEENKLTLFIEIDDVLLHTYICDENFGYMANPAAKDPEHEFFLPDIN